MAATDDIDCKIFVGSIDFNATENDVEDAFRPYGEIVHVVLLRDKETQKSRGYGFVTFKEKSSVEAAISGMNKQPILGRPIVVNYAEKKSGGGSNNQNNSQQNQRYSGGYQQQQQQQQPNPYYQGYQSPQGYGWNQYGGWGQQQGYWPQQAFSGWAQQAQAWNQRQQQQPQNQQQGSNQGNTSYQQSQTYSSANGMNYSRGSTGDGY